MPSVLSNVTKSQYSDTTFMSVQLPKDWSPLHIAAYRNETWRLSELSAGQSISQVDQLGMSALHVAAEQGHSIAALLLLTLGAPVNLRDSDGWTPMHYAAAGGHAQVIKVLFNAQGNVDAIADGGTTPLHLASGFDQSAARRVLLQCGADISSEDIYRRQAGKKTRKKT